MRNATLPNKNTVRLYLGLLKHAALVTQASWGGRGGVTRYIGRRGEGGGEGGDRVTLLVVGVSLLTLFVVTLHRYSCYLLS